MDRNCQGAQRVVQKTVSSGGKGMPVEADVPKETTRDTMVAATVKMMGILSWFMALLPFSCALAMAGESPEINFDKIVFLSSWTKLGEVQLGNDK